MSLSNTIVRPGNGRRACQKETLPLTVNLD